MAAILHCIHEGQLWVHLKSCGCLPKSNHSRLTSKAGKNTNYSKAAIMNPLSPLNISLVNTISDSCLSSGLILKYRLPSRQTIWKTKTEEYHQPKPLFLFGMKDSSHFCPLCSNLVEKCLPSILTKMGKALAWTGWPTPVEKKKERFDKKKY